MNTLDDIEDLDKNKQLKAHLLGIDNGDKMLLIILVTQDMFIGFQRETIEGVLSQNYKMLDKLGVEYRKPLN